MRLLFRLILWLILLSPFALAAAAWFALAEQPLVTTQVQLSHQDIANAKAIVKKYDPRRLPAGTAQRLSVSQRELNLAANYLLQKAGRGAARVVIQDGALDAVGTVQVPLLPQHNYLNLSLQLTDDRGTPRVDRLQLGSLEIPPVLADLMLSEGLSRLYRTHEYQLASDVVQQLAMSPGELQVTYKWDPELIKRARTLLVSGGDAAALAAYHARLLQLQAAGTGLKGSLPDLLAPLFSLAQERSVGTDPQAENLALLTLLGAWSSRRGLDQLVPDATAQPQRFRLRLENRIDFAQHFLTSAALAARGDSSLANAVGLYKEFADADGGSGFSFTDIAADRAGTRFGELAVRSPADARRVQALLAAGVAETDIMPRARDLPEHMQAVEFESRFGGVDDPRYRELMAEIERRVAACSIHN